MKLLVIKILFLILMEGCYYHLDEDAVIAKLSRNRNALKYEEEKDFLYIYEDLNEQIDKYTKIYEALYSSIESADQFNNKLTKLIKDLNRTKNLCLKLAFSQDEKDEINASFAKYEKKI